MIRGCWKCVLVYILQKKLGRMHLHSGFFSADFCAPVQVTEITHRVQTVYGYDVSDITAEPYVQP